MQFSTLTCFWASMSDAQRLAWITYAAAPGHTVQNRLGVAVPISGYNWFKLANMNRALAGLGATASVPTLATPIAPAIAAMAIKDWNDGSTTATLTCAAGTFTGYYCMLHGAYTISQGQQRNYNLLRVVRVAAIGAGTSFDFAAALVALYGTPIVGAKFTALVRRFQAEGLVSAPTVKTCLVTHE